MLIHTKLGTLSAWSRVFRLFGLGLITITQGFGGCHFELKILEILNYGK